MGFRPPAIEIPFRWLMRISTVAAQAGSVPAEEIKFKQGEECSHMRPRGHKLDFLQIF